MIKLFFCEKSTLFLLCKEKKKEKKFETKFLKIIFFATASSSLTASGAKQSVFLETSFQTLFHKVILIKIFFKTRD